MHLFAMTRGINDQTWKFVQDMSAQWCSHRWTQPDGSVMKGGVQIAMRPVFLWEIIFPEESLNDILANLEPHNWRTATIKNPLVERGRTKNI